jgi:hypothetical protein
MQCPTGPIESLLRFFVAINSLQLTPVGRGDRRNVHSIQLEVLMPARVAAVVVAPMAGGGAGIVPIGCDGALVDGDTLRGGRRRAEELAGMQELLDPCGLIPQKR